MMGKFNYSRMVLDKKHSEEAFVQLTRDPSNVYISPGEDLNLREFLIPQIMGYFSKTIDDSLGDHKKYETDVRVGLILYDLLPPAELGIRNASNDDFWRYLSLKIFPDLVNRRWGFKSDRYWERGNRIWLKVIWWYVHLSWQGDSVKTSKLLLSPSLTTDTIVQLVERTGRYGYRIELYRMIMKKAVESELNSNEFRALMIMNTIKSVNLEPKLSSGGFKGYCEYLISLIRDTE